MKFVRKNYVALCILCFILTSGGGVVQTLWPRLLSRILGFTVVNSFNARVLGLAVVALGLAYLLAVIYEEAKKPLLIIVTSFFCLGVLYELFAFFMGQVNWLVLGDALAGCVIIAFGIMVIRMPPDSKS